MAKLHTVSIALKHILSARILSQQILKIPKYLLQLREQRYERTRRNIKTKIIIKDSVEGADDGYAQSSLGNFIRIIGFNIQSFRSVAD
jgi:hypothetical protein